jgi:hypothetical protein
MSRNKAFMRHHIQRLFIALSFMGLISAVNAQEDSAKIIQFSGQVVTEYENGEIGAVPFVNIYVKDQSYRGTYADESGFFSIVAKTGETVVFSALGFKTEEFSIPEELEGNRYTVFQYLSPDTINLPEAVVYPWPSREHFKIEFLTMNVDDELQQTALENLNPETMAQLAETLPPDGREATDFYFKQQAQTYYSYGQFKPMRIFSPLAWSRFFKALKRGDFSKDEK